MFQKATEPHVTLCWRSFPWSVTYFWNDTRVVTLLFYIENDFIIKFVLQKRKESWRIPLEIFQELILLNKLSVNQVNPGVIRNQQSPKFVDASAKMSLPNWCSWREEWSTDRPYENNISAVHHLNDTKTVWEKCRNMGSSATQKAVHLPQ